MYRTAAALAAVAAALFAAAPAHAAGSPGRWQTDYYANGAGIARWDPALIGGSCQTAAPHATVTVNRARILRLHSDGTAGACAVRSSRRSFGPGRFSAKIRFPGDTGGLWDWPAFWTVGAGKPWPDGGEIDVAEVLGNPPEGGQVCAAYHYGQPAPQETGPVCDRQADTGWHVYSVVWAGHVLTFRIDGRTFAVIRGSQVAPAAQRVVFDLANRVAGRQATVRVAWFRHEQWRP
jgi:hypothetical protein